MFIRFLYCVVFLFSCAVGQPFHEDPGHYYIGRGEHASLDVARARAYANMVEQIQVLVSSTLRTSSSEHNSALQQTADQSTSSMSLIVLRDVQESIDQGQGVYRVIKYVPKSVVQSIFEQRRGQVLDYLRAAEAEGDATAAVDLQRMLGDYYKAWLMAGLYPDTISYSFKFGGAGQVTTGIPRAMQLVSDNVAFSPSRKIGDEYTTWKYAVTWSGRPVKKLRFTLHDGLGESEEAVAGGLAQVTFFFTDKRERRIPVTIYYRDVDQQDALLAIADSIQAGFAPVLTLQLLLPGELNATVKDTMTHSANLDLDHSAVITAAGICSTEQRDESVIAVYPEPHATTVSRWLPPINRECHSAPWRNVAAAACAVRIVPSSFFASIRDIHTYSS